LINRLQLSLFCFLHECAGLVLENPSLLHAAIVSEKLRITQLLIDMGINLNLRDSKGRTPVCLACIYYYEDGLRLLIEAGADIFLQDNNGYLPIHWAVMKNSNIKKQPYNETQCFAKQRQCVELLLQSGVSVSAHNFAKREPIHIAARLGQMSMIEYLVSQGADVNAEMIDGRTPLLEVVSGMEEEARQIGRVQLVQALLALGADPSQGDVSGRTPLHWACFYSHDKMIKALIAANADVKAADDEGVTPIHLMCLRGSLEFVTTLKDRGADASAPDAHMRTPLHYAARAGAGQVCQYLVDHAGANPDAVDDLGLTASDLAEGQNQAEIYEVLQRSSHQRNERLHKTELQ
jgi:ankyrin repeat protein